MSIENQEFTSPSRERLVPEFIDKIRADLKKEKMEEIPNDPRLEKILDEIDFRLLEDIFKEYLNKSGVSGPINFVGKDGICHSASRDSDAEFFPIENMIGVSYDNILTVGADPKFLVLYKLCHEEAHAISRRKMMIKITQDERGVRVNPECTTSGYREEDFYRALNEAVMEKLTQEVLAKYLQSKPDFLGDEKIATLTLNRFKENPNLLSPYQQELKLLELIVGKLAREVGVDEKNSS